MKEMCDKHDWNHHVLFTPCPGESLPLYCHLPPSPVGVILSALEKGMGLRISKGLLEERMWRGLNSPLNDVGGQASPLYTFII